MNRWPVVLFGNCIDVGAVGDAIIIWLVNFPEWSHLRDNAGTSTGANHATSPARVPDTKFAGVDTFGNDDGTTAPGQSPQAQQAVGVVKRRICCLCPCQVDKKVRLERGAGRKPVFSDHCT